MYTFIELTLRPGHAIDYYINHDRSKLINPVKYALLAITIGVIYSLLSDYLLPEILLDITDDTSESIIVYASIPIYTLSFALIMYWLFKSVGYNYFEHLVIIIFLLSHGIIIINLLTGLVHLGGFMLTNNKVFVLHPAPIVVGYVLLVLYLIYSLTTIMKKPIWRVFLVILISHLIIIPVLGSFVNLFIDFSQAETILGITIKYPEEEKVLYDQYKLGERELTLVIDSIVMNGIAGNAGLRKGDTIIEVDGTEADIQSLRRQIQTKQPSGTILLKIIRGGIVEEAQLTLEE